MCTVNIHQAKIQLSKLVDTVLRGEEIIHHKQKQIVSLFGQIDYDPDYDYKEERRRK